MKTRLIKNENNKTFTFSDEFGAGKVREIVGLEGVYITSDSREDYSQEINIWTKEGKHLESFPTSLKELKSENSFYAPQVIEFIKNYIS